MNYFDVILHKTKLCCVRGCRHKPEKTGRFCRRCRDRRYKQTHPISYAWDKLKYNARRRGKPFTITFGYFEQWCLETGYIEHVGKTAQALTIDRKDFLKGYEPGNLQILTNQDNGRKAHLDKKLLAYAPGEHPFL